MTNSKIITEKALRAEAEGQCIRVIFYAFAVTFFLRKKPPAMQISSAAPATIAEPTKPETVVPAALSLFAKA